MAAKVAKVHASTLTISYSGVMTVPAVAGSLDTKSDTTTLKQANKFTHGSGMPRPTKFSTTCGRSRPRPTRRSCSATAAWRTG